jgi:hypothetical protein
MLHKEYGSEGSFAKCIFGRGSQGIGDEKK